MYSVVTLMHSGSALIWCGSSIPCCRGRTTTLLPLALNQVVKSNPPTGTSHPGMDSVAVSVLVIKSLAALRTPLVDPGSCQQLLGLAFSRDGPQVKLSCLTQIMGSRSGVHHGEGACLMTWNGLAGCSVARSEVVMETLWA